MLAMAVIGGISLAMIEGLLIGLNRLAGWEMLQDQLNKRGI